MKTKLKNRFWHYIVSLITLIIIFTSSSQASAGGVPQFSYTYYGPTTNVSSLNECYGCTASKDLMQISVGAPNKFGGAGVFHIGNNSSSLVGLYYVTIYGSNDGTNWSWVAQSGTYPYNSDFSYNLSGGLYTYLKAVGTYTNSDSWYTLMFSWSSQGVYAVVADQSTAQAAADNAFAANQAAQATVSYAQNASTQASNASSYANQALNWLDGTWGGYNLGSVGNYANQAVNWLNGTWGGYSLGTVGQNATNAMNNAASANTNATNAYNQTISANNTLNNSTYGLNAINNNVNTASTNAANAVTSITNLQNNMAYLIPPNLYKVTGYNNATATTSTSFNVSLNYSTANEYQVKVDNGAWSGWTSLSSYASTGYITVGGISGSGAHTIYVNIRNNNGAGIVSPVTSGEISVYKL